jgi:hypothetical protein
LSTSKLDWNSSKLLEAAPKKGGAGSESNAEIAQLKRANENLKEQLDDALALGPTSIPQSLKQEFIKFCKGNEKYSDLKDKDFNAEICVKILKSHKISAVSSSSMQASAVGSSLEGGS